MSQPESSRWPEEHQHDLQTPPLPPQVSDGVEGSQLLGRQVGGHPHQGWNWISFQCLDLRRGQKEKEGS